MAIELVQLTRNTRGLNSREIKFMAIGKWVEKIVKRDTRPDFDENGKKKEDKEGNEIRLPLEKDAEGNNIYVEEIEMKFESDGVLTEVEDAMELCKGDGQLLLDCFVDGFNERQYAKEAGKDELDEFIAELEMNDDQKAAFKKTARGIVRNYGLTLTEAAEHVKLLMAKAKEKADALAAKNAAAAETVPA